MEISHTEDVGDLGGYADVRDDASSPLHLPAVLPCLPDELAILCIARVPSIAHIWSVSKAWRRVLASSILFQTVRRQIGLTMPQWLYALLKTPSSSTSFEWHAYDPLACTWHPLPPLPIPIAFHLSSPYLIGHTYSVQCAASATCLFMVAGCQLCAVPLQTSHPLAVQESSSSQYGALQEEGENRAQSGDLQNQDDRISQRGGWQQDDEVQSAELQAQVEGQIRMRFTSPLAAHAPQHPTQPRASLTPALPSPLMFDTISKTWSFSSPLFYGPRCWCATGIDSCGKLYIASGCGTHWDLDMSKSAEKYDAKHDTWTPIEGLGSSKFSGEAITAVNYQGKLHMVSGRGVFNKVGVMYDAELGRWMDMPRGMKAGWTGACVVVDGMLLAVDENMGRLRLYESETDTWRMLVEHPKLKGLGQVVAAPGGKVCGLMKGPHGRCGGGDSHDFVRIVCLSPSPADLAASSLVSCQLNFLDIVPPAPNAMIVNLQLLSSIVSPSPCSVSD